MKKIFIIDDDVYIGDMLEEVLTKEGYAVSRAYSGTEALLLLSGDKPDLVLLDLMLPGLSGEKVMEKIRYPRYRGERENRRERQSKFIAWRRGGLRDEAVRYARAARTDNGAIARQKKRLCRQRRAYVRRYRN